MSEENCISFLVYLDEICRLGYEISELENAIKKANKEDLEAIEKSGRTLKKPTEGFIDISENRRFILQKKLKQRDQDLLVLPKIVIDAESLFYDCFLENLYKEFRQDINEGRDVSTQDFLKFYKLSSKFMDEKEAEGIPKSSIKFKNHFADNKGKYLKKIISHKKEQYKEGQLSLGAYLKEIKLLENELREFDCIGYWDLSSEIFDSINTGNSDVNNIIDDLYNQGMLAEIDNYSILELKGKKEIEYLLIKDGEIQAPLKSSHANSEKFDFTIAEGEDIQKAIDEFEKLKTKRKNRNAKINILDRTVIIDNKGKKSYYLINDGELEPIEKQNCNIKPISSYFDSYRNKSNSLIEMPKRSFMSKIFDILKHKGGEDGDIIANNGGQSERSKLLSRVKYYGVKYPYKNYDHGSVGEDRYK